MAVLVPTTKVNYTTHQQSQALVGLCRLPLRNPTTVRITVCDPQSCILAQEEEPCLQNRDPRRTGHVCCVYFSLLVCLLISLVGCGGGSTTRLDDSYVELQFYCAVSNFGQRFISLGSVGLDKYLEDTQEPYPVCGPAHSTSHYTVQVWVERCERKKGNSLGTMKIGGSGDSGVERKGLM